MTGLISIIGNDSKAVFSRQNSVLLLLTILTVVLLPSNGTFYERLLNLSKGIIPTCLVLISAGLLTKEFESRAYLYQFTGKYSRISLLSFKLLSSLAISMILGIGFGIFLLAAAVVNGHSGQILKELINMQIVILVYAFLLNSVSFLITLVTKNYLITLTVLFVLFVDTFGKIIAYAIDTVPLPFLETIFAYTIKPIFVASEGFSSWSYTSEAVLSILTISCLIFLLDISIVHHRDFV